jgi:hypothetical protein
MGFVYVITDCIPEEDYYERLSNVDYVKIGFTSNDVSSRIAQLQTGNPREINLVYLFEFENTEMAKQVERIIHWKLRGLEKLGEWFHYSEVVYTVLKAVEKISIFSSHTCPSDEAIKQHNLSKKVMVING